MTRLAIIIVTYNSRGEVDACLAALAAGPWSITHEVVVVDNASPDGSADHVRRRWPGVRVIETGENRGFAAANNVGLRGTASDLALLLNPDTIVAPGAIDALVAALDAHPDAAIVGPRIVDGQGRAELSFGRMPSPFADLRQKTLVRLNDRGAAWVVRWVDRATRRRRLVDWVSGACLLIRRTDLEAAGLLDERYFMYLEDVDLCTTVRARGRQVLFEPGAEIVHLRGRSVASIPARTRAAYRRSQIAFYEKHRPGWAPFLKAYLNLKRATR